MCHARLQLLVFFLKSHLFNGIAITYHVTRASVVSLLFVVGLLFIVRVRAAQRL